jgi:hypothetical protein
MLVVTVWNPPQKKRTFDGADWRARELRPKRLRRQPHRGKEDRRYLSAERNPRNLPHLTVLGALRGPGSLLAVQSPEAPDAFRARRSQQNAQRKYPLLFGGRVNVGARFRSSMWRR